jgi:hypothetical protein
MPLLRAAPRQRMMTEWNLQSRAHACQACSRPFADKHPYHTLLFDQNAGYERFDICEPCWAGQYSQGAGDRRGFVSHWQGVYAAPPAAAPEPIQHETAESLLRKLVEQNDPHYAAARYILAVMLERKRVLKVKDQLRSEGRRTFLYEHAGNGDLFSILDPDLQLHQLEAVQREVAQLLEHGLNPPPAAEAAPAPVAGEPAAEPEPEAAPAAS